MGRIASNNVIYAVCTTDRLETMLFVSNDKREVADYLHLSLMGLDSAIRRFKKNPNANHMKDRKLVIIPEEDLPDED